MQCFPSKTALTSHLYGELLTLLTGLFALSASLLTADIPYTFDSTNYIEQARSLMAGNGFESREFGMSNMEASYVPDKIYPPGYPLVIAAASGISGAPVETVAPWINRLALMSLPLIVFIALKPVVGRYSAACIGIVGGLSPGVIHWGQFALTDVFSLALVVASFGLTLAAWSSDNLKRASLLALCGGLGAGFAYLTRNVNLALLLAAALFIGITLIASSPVEKAGTWKVSILWILGASLVVLPWLIRNAIVFGRIQPYEVPAGTISARTNLQSFIIWQVAEVFGSSYIGIKAGSSISGVTTLLLLGVSFSWLSTRNWEELQPGERRALIFSLVYVFLGSSVVITARTKYQAFEAISSRYTLQYTVFLLCPAAIVLRRLAGHRQRYIVITSAIMVFLMIPRLMEIEGRVNRRSQITQSQLVLQLIGESKSTKIGPCAHDKKYLYFSNYAGLYRILCDANVQYIDVDNMGGNSTIENVVKFFDYRTDQRPVMVSLHPSITTGSFSLQFRGGDGATFDAQGWIILENSPLILRLTNASHP